MNGRRESGEMQLCWSDERTSGAVLDMLLKMASKGGSMNKKKITFVWEQTSLALIPENPRKFALCEKHDRGKMLKCCEMQCQHNNTDSLENSFISPPRIPLSPNLSQN